MRKLGILMSLALVLCASARSFAAVADWAEEMRTTVAGSDKGWTNFEGNWGSTVDSSSGETWVNLTNNGNIGTAVNPTVNQQQYTLEYRFRFLTAVPLGQGLVTGAWLYNSGDGPNSDPIGRTRHQFGTIDGTADTDLGFEVIHAGDNRFNFENPIGTWPVDEWQTVRVSLDNLAATPVMSMYLNGALVKSVSHQSGASLVAGQDDPGLYFGAQDGGTAVDAEWDYIRIKVGSVVPIGEALNAVPEPTTLGMLALSGLAMIRRRRS